MFESGEIEDVNLDRYGNVVSVSNNKIALIDADTLVYRVNVSTEVQEEILPKEFYSEDEWNSLLVRGATEETPFIKTIDVPLAVSKVVTELEDLLLATGCKDFELHFSEGRENFRYLIYPDYKGNRKSADAPVGLSEVKKAVSDVYPDKSYIHTSIEADDVVVSKYNKDTHILCAVDKDVLFNVAGTHYNYYRSALHNIQPKFIDVDEDTAMKYPYKQVLTGDTTDNIKGLYGIGKVKADKALADCTTAEECWNVVVQMYQENNRNVEDAILNMQLVNMYQVDTSAVPYVLELWSPVICKGDTNE